MGDGERAVQVQTPPHGVGGFVIVPQVYQKDRVQLV